MLHCPFAVGSFSVVITLLYKHMKSIGEADTASTYSLFTITYYFPKIDP